MAKKPNITPRSPGGKALSTGQFRQQIVPTKTNTYDLRVCESCGFKWIDCDCVEDDDYNPYPDDDPSWLGDDW